MKLKFFFLAVLYNSFLNAQVGIGTTTPNGALDITSTTNGFLPPRVSLTAINLEAPIVNPNGGAVAQGTIVWNTVTANTGVAAPPNNIAPGLYIWDGTKWSSLAGNTSSIDWSLIGNAGTTAGTNFIGTTDNQDLIFKRNNVRAGRIGTLNTSFGLGALNPIVVGSNNSAFGTYSLFSTTTGSNNSAFGVNVLNLLTTGFQNVGIGTDALGTLTTGTDNIAIGINALHLSTNGSYNFGIGSHALESNILGNQNIAIGHSSLKKSLGNSNYGIGHYSLENLINGDSNCGLGYETLMDLEDGSNNVAIGHGAGRVLTSGVNNIFIGNYTHPYVDDGDNQLNIGNLVFGWGLNGDVNTPAGNIGIGEQIPNSKLQVAGPIATAVDNFKPSNPASLTVNESMSVIIFDANCTITLPNPTTCKGRQLTFLRHNNPTTPLLTSTTNIISSTGATTTNIAGTSGNTCIIVSDGTNWNIVN